MANENPKPLLDEKALAGALAEALKPVLESIAAKGGGSTPERSRKYTTPLAAEHKGTKTYFVGPGGHYRNNRLYKAGDLITVTDERPAKDWKLAPEDKQKGAAKPKA